MWLAPSSERLRLWFAPSSGRLRLWFALSSERWSWCLYLSLCEVDCGCLAKGLPLLCEVVFVLPRWRLYWLSEELCTPGCSCPKSSVEVPCVGVLGG